MKLFADFITNRKRVALPDDLFLGTTDIPSHILPGVDDGIADAEEAVRALSYLNELGFQRAVLTPHVMAEYAGNRRDTLQEHFEQFVAHTALPSISLSLAAEYMVDDAFASHVEEGYLTMGKGGFVLTETSYVNSHPNHSQLLYQLSLEGYNPIIAHPERYLYASDRQYDSWKRKGYAFQLNLLSLAGAYGEPAEEKALRFLDKGYYDFVGTDLHKVDTYRHWLPKVRLTVKQMDALRGLLENNRSLSCLS